jgi:hypothetical protein
MPLRPGVVFLEETCLVSRPALPFATLKRRLERRLRAMGVKVGLSQVLSWYMYLCMYVCIYVCDFIWSSETHGCM